jgi:glutathione peroxidase
MKRAYASILGLVLLGTAAPVWSEACPQALDFEMRRLGGDETVNLCEAYRGKVALIVNTASRCAFTPQYEGLEALYERYQERGFVVLGFPSNDFGAQEPGSEQEVKSFCRLTYGVRFPMFEKTHAAEARADPLYRALAEQAGEYPSWNFHKYLLDRDGRVVGSYSSFIPPESSNLIRAIESLL